MKLDLVANRSDRKMVMAEKNEAKLLDMLKKLGTVTDYMTGDMVAQFYGVGERAIADIATTKGDELVEYGYKVYRRSEILNMELPYLEKIPNRGLRLYPVKAVIVIGMMLTESEVAESLRKEIVQVIFGEAESKSQEELLLAAIEKNNQPIYAILSQNNQTLNMLMEMVNEDRQEKKEYREKKEKEDAELRQEIKKLEAKIVQESSMKKFEDLAEKQFKEQCKTDTRTMRNQFMAEVDVKCIHLDRALKPAELAKYYKKDSKEFNSWLQSIGLQHKEAGCWVIAQKYKDQGYSDTFTGPYGTYLGWTLKGCILIYDLLAARGKYPQIQEAFEQ